MAAASAAPSDRRSTLTLTPKAAAAGDEIYGPFAGELTEAARELSSSERLAITVFLSRAGEIAARHARRPAGADGGR